MALTSSHTVALGTQAPDFTLPDVVSGEMQTLAHLKSDKATVIMFICNHCPYVKHVNPELVRMANAYMNKGVSFIAISSNNIEDYPEDSPEEMKKVARHWNYPFPYLYDATQEIAKAYDAACTPDFYIFNKDLKLVYHGRLDESKPGSEVLPSGKDLRKALDDILKSNPVSEEQFPSIGCNIKWKT